VGEDRFTPNNWHYVEPCPNAPGAKPRRSAGGIPAGAGQLSGEVVEAFCDAAVAVAEERREEGRQRSVDTERLARLGSIVIAFGGFLGFILTRLENGLPRKAGEIALVAALGAAATVTLALAINELLAVENRPRVIRGLRSFFLLAIVTFATLAGVFAELAPSADEADSGGGSAEYARHLRNEIRKLQQPPGLASANSATSRQAYSREARELGAVYEEVVSDLRRIEVDTEDRAVHRRLVHRVAAASRAYRHLGKVVLQRLASKAQVDAARTQVRKARAEVLSTEQELEQHGYRIRFPDA
jgi:hypothetical protein